MKSRLKKTTKKYGKKKKNKRTRTMVNLFNENKKQFVAKEKPKNEMYSLIYWYLRLQGQEPNQVVAKRYLRDASDLLKLGTIDEIKARCIEVKKYAEKQNISWSLNYVIKSWGKVLGSPKEILQREYDKRQEEIFKKQNEEFNKKYNQPRTPRTPEEQAVIDRMFEDLKVKIDENTKKMEEEQRVFRIKNIKERLGYREGEKIITDKEIAEMIKAERVEAHKRSLLK